MSKVFVLEDDPLFAASLVRDLTGNGYEVEVWGSLGGATELIKEGNFDLLILDVIIPYEADVKGNECHDGGIRVSEALHSNGITIPTCFCTICRREDFVERLNPLGLPTLDGEIPWIQKESDDKYRKLLADAKRFEKEYPGGQAHSAGSEQRWINAEIRDHDPDVPLAAGETYTLEFYVDTELRSKSLGGDPLEDSGLYSDEDEQVTLTVLLTSDDFCIFTEPQQLVVPRHGKSQNRARFDVQPKREGPCLTRAYFFKDGNIIQRMELTLQCGQAVQATAAQDDSNKRGVTKKQLGSTAGRPLDEAFRVQPRNLTFVFEPMGEGFSLMILRSGRAIKTTLRISRRKLEETIDKIRNALVDILYVRDSDGNDAYRSLTTQISEEINDSALRVLAEHGAELYGDLFLSDPADTQSHKLSRSLRHRLMETVPLKIQIVSNELLLPWGLLYVDEYDEDAVKPDMFLGFRHIVECIPLQSGDSDFSPTFNNDECLTVHLNENEDIDGEEGDVKLVERHLRYWGRIEKETETTVTVNKTKSEVKQALRGLCPQVSYFYCHGEFHYSESDGANLSKLIFTNEECLTLGEAKRVAAIDNKLGSNPLVFLNACESGELKLLRYDGFAPYFMARGARCVIGTECPIPAFFACEWAERLFNCFLAGDEELGQIILNLRQHYRLEHRNLLGLLYTLYGDADTKIMNRMQVHIPCDKKQRVENDV